MNQKSPEQPKVSIRRILQTALVVFTIGGFPISLTNCKNFPFNSAKVTGSHQVAQAPAVTTPQGL